MNFRKGTTFVLMGLRLKLNNIRSKSNGTRSPLKNLELIKTESGLRNVRRRPMDIRTKLSGFKTEKISTRVGLDNLKSSMNICTTIANHTLQMGLTSAESRLNNVISKVKTVTPEIENIQAGLQSTMQTSRAKLQKSLDFGFEKTQSGLDNVRNSLDSGLEKTRSELDNVQNSLYSGLKKTRTGLDTVRNSLDSGLEKTRSELANVRNSLDSGLEKTRSELDNVRSRVSKTILHLDKTRSKLSDRRLRLPENFRSGFKNIRSKSYTYQKVQTIVSSEINNNRIGQYLLRIGYKMIESEYMTRPRSESKCRPGRFYRSRFRSNKNRQYQFQSEDNHRYRNRPEKDFQYPNRSEENRQYQYGRENNRQHRYGPEENRQYQHGRENNRQHRYRWEDNRQFRYGPEDNRQSQYEDNRNYRSRCEENGGCCSRCCCKRTCNCKNANYIDFFMKYFFRVVVIALNIPGFI